MKFEFVHLENFTSDIADLIIKLAKPHTGYDNLDAKVITQEDGCWGTVELEFFTCRPPYVHRDFKIVEQAYFSICAN